MKTSADKMNAIDIVNALGDWWDENGDATGPQAFTMWDELQTWLDAVRYAQRHPLPRADKRMLAAAADLVTVISNVMTDDQLDAPVPALQGRTARELLKELAK